MVGSPMSNVSNVFVLGLEPFNLGLLDSVLRSGETRFRELPSADEAVEVAPRIDCRDILRFPRSGVRGSPPRRRA